MPTEPPDHAITVYYLDNDLIVADKPSGIPAQSDHSGAADLLGRLAGQLSIPLAALYPVHRLDRPVSGLVVVARHAAAQTALTRQMASHEMHKTYHAVVFGKPDPDCGERADYLVKNERLNTSRVAGPDNRQARLARLLYRTAASLPTADGQVLSLLTIDLLTGRHHQIRVQLAHAGWPLWGDTKYNPACRLAGGWQQLALCATHLSFRHPASGILMSFQRPMPDQKPFTMFSDASITTL